MKTIVFLMTIVFPLFANPLETAIHGDAKDFSAEFIPSNTNIGLNQEFAIILNLKYPSSYHPQIKTLQNQLLNFQSYGQAPFLLINEKITPPITDSSGITTQSIKFTLSPILPGKHFITFKKIIFFSNGGIGPNINILSDIHEVIVRKPDIAFHFQDYIESPLSLTQKLLITTNLSNRKMFLQNGNLNHEIKKFNQSLLKEKAIPWFYFFSLLATIFAIVLIKIFPIKKISILSLQKSPLDHRNQAIEIIENLSTKISQGEPNTLDYFRIVDHTIRQYFDKLYHIGSTTLTSQELKKKNFSTISNMKSHTRDQFLAFLEQNEHVKYKNRLPSIEECNALKQIALKILNETWTGLEI